MHIRSSEGGQKKARVTAKSDESYFLTSEKKVKDCQAGQSCSILFRAKIPNVIEVFQSTE